MAWHTQPVHLPDSCLNRSAYPTCLLQLAGSVFRLVFEPLPSAGCDTDAGPVAKQLKTGQPGSLRISGLGSLGHGPALGSGEPDGQLGTLLAAALPPGAILHQLELVECRLEAATLQQLPVLASLQRLVVRKCQGSGGLDAMLQVLVQRAPALTSLYFVADRQLRCWPTYLVAHPSLRSATVFNRGVAWWGVEEASQHLPTAADAKSGRISEPPLPLLAASLPSRLLLIVANMQTLRPPACSCLQASPCRIMVLLSCSLPHLPCS